MRRWGWLLAATATACRAEPIPADRRFPAGTDFVARHVVAAGTPIRYIDAGRGRPVVFLHGLGASMYAWRHLLPPVVEAGYRVIAFDNRGFGFSGRPDSGYSNGDYVHLLGALLDTLGAAGVVLVGHSMGGQIATEFALAHPAKVEGLALIDASGYGIRMPSLLRVIRWPVVGRLATALRGREITGRILRSTYGDPARVTDDVVDQYYAPVAQRDYGRTLRGVLQEYRFDALIGRLDSLRVATLVLWGEHDRLIPPPLGRRLAMAIERVAFLQIPDAGHALPEETPAEVTRVLLAFLAGRQASVPQDLASTERR